MERGFFNNTWISYKDTLCRNQAGTSEKMCLNNGKDFTFWQPLELHNKNFVTLCSVMNSWYKSLNFPLSSNFFLKRTLEKQEVNGKRICQVTIPGGLWLSHPLGMVLMVGGKGSWKMSQRSWNAALLVTELCWSCTPLNAFICLEKPQNSWVFMEVFTPFYSLIWQSISRVSPFLSHSFNVTTFAYWKWRVTDEGRESIPQKNQGAAWNSSCKKEQQVKMSWLTTAQYFPTTSLLTHAAIHCSCGNSTRVNKHRNGEQKCPITVWCLALPLPNLHRNFTLNVLFWFPHQGPD